MDSSAMRLQFNYLVSYRYFDTGFFANLDNLVILSSQSAGRKFIFNSLKSQW